MRFTDAPPIKDDSSVDANIGQTSNVIAAATATTGRDVCDGQAQNEQNEDDSCHTHIDAVPMKKQSSLFHNALRPNSAVRQLFPSVAQQSLPAAPLTHESLRAFEDAKRLHIGPAAIATAAAAHSDTETDTIRRTIERNALRRSLIKYEPK